MNLKDFFNDVSFFEFFLEILTVVIFLIIVILTV